MAGGGGTRLRPVSTAGRPKPFLPLLRRRDAAPADGAPARGATSSVPSTLRGGVDRRYAPLVAAQVPDATGRHRARGPQHRGRDRARGARRRPRRRRGHGRAARGPPHRPGPGGPLPQVLARGRRRASPAARSGSRAARHAWRPADPRRRRSTAISCRASMRGERHRRPARRIRSRRSRRSRRPRARRSSSSMPGVAWNAGMFLWRRGRSGRRSRSTRRRRRGGRARRLVGDMRRALRADQARVSIDYAVMEPRGRGGRVVMAAMDVGWSDLGTGRRCSRCSARRGIDGGVVRPASGVDDERRRPRRRPGRRVRRPRARRRTIR